jgi:predicted DsbA family dithiol-disulfide isomerase
MAIKSMEGKAEFEVNWRPFFLNRDATRKGVNKLQYYNDKFGAARVAQMVCS